MAPGPMDACPCTCVRCTATWVLGRMELCHYRPLSNGLPSRCAPHGGCKEGRFLCRASRCFRRGRGSVAPPLPSRVEREDAEAANETPAIGAVKLMRATRPCALAAAAGAAARRSWLGGPGNPPPPTYIFDVPVLCACACAGGSTRLHPPPHGDSR